MRKSALAFAVLAGLFSLAASRVAAADDTIRTPGDHPIYRIEGEPMLLWGWTDYGWAATEGYGVGGRLSFPILDNGFIPKLNNSVAITTGLNFVHYDAGCVSYPGGCASGGSANYIFIPIAMQWNFYVAKRWSVFGEPGFVIYHGFYDNPCAGLAGCNAHLPGATSVDWAFYAGARFHINRHIALVMRVGYPDFSFGVSFM